MKDEVFAVLAKFDSYFYTATYASFIRSLTKNEMKELIEAAKEVGIIYVHNGCPKCSLDFIKKLAVPYYKEKAAREEAAKIKLEELNKEAQKPTKQKKGKNYGRETIKSGEKPQADERPRENAEETSSEA